MLYSCNVANFLLISTATQDYLCYFVQIDFTRQIQWNGSKTGLCGKKSCVLSNQIEHSCFKFFTNCKQLFVTVTLPCLFLSSVAACDPVAPPGPSSLLGPRPLSLLDTAPDDRLSESSSSWWPSPATCNNTNTYFWRLLILSGGTRLFTGSFKSQHIDYFRGHIVFWDKPLQFYDN